MSFIGNAAEDCFEIYESSEQKLKTNSMLMVGLEDNSEHL